MTRIRPIPNTTDPAGLRLEQELVLQQPVPGPKQLAGAVDLEASLQDAETSPVMALVDLILLQAMSVSASDIHVEPQQNGLRLRYRQDGVLQQ